MFYAVGQGTNTIYAKGRYKSECMRKLNERFPTFEYKSINFKSRASVVEQILPEPIIIKKGK